MNVLRWLTSLLKRLKIMYCNRIDIDSTEHTADIWWAIAVSIAQTIEAEGWSAILFVTNNSPHCPYLVQVYDVGVDMVLGAILIHKDKIEVNKFHRKSGLYDPIMVGYEHPKLFELIIKIFKTHIPYICHI